MKISRPFLFACLLAATALASAHAASSLANLSSRGLVGSASGSLVAGFVVEGSEAKSILLRGVGPGLAAFGVVNAASAVTVNIYDAGGHLITTNRGFQTNPNADLVAETASRVGAFPLSAEGDSATCVTLMPGAYSLEIAPGSQDAPDGSALLEVYDADPAGTTGRLANFSTRALVGPTTGTLISGFVITGTASKILLIRSVGPDLAVFGIANAAGPLGIRVFDSNYHLVAKNTGYLTGPDAVTLVRTAAQVGAFPLGDTGDSAVVVLLAPGAYFVEATSSTSDAPGGVGLVEVYDADSPSAEGDN